MNKKELIAAAAKECGLTQTDVDKVLNDGIIPVIEKTVAAGEKVQMVGFGAFEARFRAGRSCRNPQTGKTIFIQDSKVPTFKPGKEFKALLNKKRAGKKRK